MFEQTRLIWRFSSMWFWNLFLKPMNICLKVDACMEQGIVQPWFSSRNPDNFNCWHILYTNYCMSDYQRSGAAEACWAHNPKVEGSKPSSAISISGLDQPMRNVFWSTAINLMKNEINKLLILYSILWFHISSDLLQWTKKRFSLAGPSLRLI